MFSGIFLVEMPSFLFLSQHRDMKAIFYLFYKITKVFSSFRDVIHVCFLRENEACSIRACVRFVLIYKYIYMPRMTSSPVNYEFIKDDK